MSRRTDGETFRVTEKQFVYGDTAQRDKLTVTGNYYNNYSLTYDALEAFFTVLSVAAVYATGGIMTPALAP